MPSISLKIILEDGAVTRTMMFPNGCTVADATQMIREKILTGSAGKDYGLFLTSADDDLSGCWLEDPRHLDYYLLKDGDSLHYRCRVRTLRIRMLDGSVKTMQVDESKSMEMVMMNVCSKLGITNYEEYGLCREDEPMDEHPSTGTLTLKRKHQHKEKDAAMQQLSKKLKTDDNVEWLEQHKTLREMSVAPSETLLLKRRLFYSDRKVDARDPVQLNLLYVQARDAVLEGRHPVTEEQAVQFAGIQCQIQYGDFQEDKHKQGFIENLSEFLPETYAKAWGIEKKVLKEHRKHSGLTQLEAKHLYTKTARDLPTYGVTFFLVKEMQKGKKKLVPRLLGINASSILRLDETTKEVLQVWPLTQVKTYKAGKEEMFTLNFGDYSEKEYCVKTNDAYRIRDILQGYIDLIRKKMEAAFNTSGDEGGIIQTATIQSGKGSTMEVVSHSAQKMVETSYVGPSKIITAEEGSKAQAHGTQIVTAHTVIVTNKQFNEQSAKTSGVTMRGEMSIDTGKKLNELNANAVKIVTLLNNPDEANIEASKNIVDTIVRDMPSLVAGVQHCIDQQPDEAAKKKLTLELNELSDNVAQLNEFLSPQEAQEAAMRIADLTTQMYFALDSRVRRRSQLVRNSRQSFIEDEKTQATIHRASFINCVGAASHAIDDARDILMKKYEGPALNREDTEALERSAHDRLAKLNAAIARLAAAHSDPKNIDYPAAVSAMNTIKKLIPELANDAQALSAVNDGKDRSGLINEMQELLDATGNISQNIGCDDVQKMHNEADKFAKKSRRLQFIFGHGVHPDLENEIIDLAKEVDDKTRLLVATVNQLAGEVNDPATPKVLNAAHKCANAAVGLTSCAQLTASCLHEPHCRSALSAAVEDLASSEKLLESTYRPLLEHPEGCNRSDSIRNQSAELRKALDRLQNAYSELEGDMNMDGPEATERKRLKFITTMAGAQKSLDSCDEILKDKYKGPALSPKETEELERSTRDKLAKLNEAIARLAGAYSDPNNIDYAAADSAMLTIQELSPELANGAQALSSVKDDKDRTSLIKEMQELLDATGMIYQSIDANNLQGMQEGTNNCAKKAKRLRFILGGADGADADRDRKQQQFANSLSGVQETLDSCEKILRDPRLGDRVVPVDRPLWASLGELNAAIASLVVATKDPENKDYAAAEAAMSNIACIMPEVVNEVKHTSSNYPPAKQDEVCANTKALCDAVRALALNAHHGEDANQAIADYARASGKLTYVFDKHALQQREHEVIDLTKKACGSTSQLLAHVYGVAAEVGGEAGYDLDVAGTKVAESAQDLLTAVQLTAPTIHTVPSKTVVLGTTDDLTSSLDNVARVWPAACKNQVDKEKLNMLKIQAEMDLKNLIVAVRNAPEPKVVTPPPNLKKSKLDVSLANKHSDLCASLLQAQEAINKPLPSKTMTPVEAKTLQQSLANKMAALNAAIAAMMASTYARDPSTIRHEEAELSMGVIQRLVPEVIEDVRALNSGKSDAETRALLEELKALCVATEELVDGAVDGNPEVLKNTAAQYANAARKLTFTCTPPTLAQKNQEQVLNKAENVLARSSVMVAAAEKLVKTLPREGSLAISEKAQQVERAASALLGTAQVTAPTLHTSQCRSALHQAATDLSQAIKDLDQATHHVVGGDSLESQRRSFDEAVKQLMATIAGLEEDSQHLNATSKAMAAEKEKNRLKFIASRSAAQVALDNAMQELKKTGKVAPLAPPQAAQLQSRLADRLATLNAAIATLLTATRDPGNPDYVLAESATATIQEIMPDLIKDAKTLPSGKEAARSKLLEQLHELCDATKAISSGDNNGKETELQDAVEKFTKASGKLVYTFNPGANSAKEGQIIDLTKSTCQKTSELLERVYELAQSVEPEAALELDDEGSRLVDAAQNLLTTAEITAPSISSPLCQSSLLTSISALSSSVDHLFSSPVLTLPQHAAKRQHLQEARAKVDQEIERLKEALKDERVLDAAAIEKAKKDKLRFIASMASAEVAIQNAEKEITEPYGKPLPESAVAALEQSLANRIATLNAAINSLIVATNDHNNPDYVEAEAISKTIRELIPDIVKDSKSLSSTKDQKSRKELLEQIKALCEATRKLGASAKSEQLSPEELNEAATQYSLASGKLNFVFNPHADQKKTHQIIDTCKSACIKTSEMLQRVHEVAKHAGAGGAALDAEGAHVSDVARSLLTTAQLTAHSAPSPLCQAALLDASDRLSSSIQELQTTWTPITNAPNFKADGEQLTKDKEAVDAEIVTLRRLVKDGGAGVLDAAAIEKAKKDKLRFIASMASAEVAIQNAEKEITEPYGKPLPESAVAALEQSLANRIATLNAAINSLIMATNDHNNPDYVEAEAISKTIRELIPDIVKDSKSLSSTKDQKSRKELLEQIKALCEATRKLGASAKSEQLSSPEELNEAATQYSLASGKLNFVFNPHADQKKTHQIIDTCKSACIKTSEMLQRVHEVAKHAGAGGAALDAEGAHVSDVARSLLTTAQLTAHSAPSPLCQAALLDASDRLSSSIQELQTTWTPITNAPNFKADGEQLTKDKEAVDAEIVTLRRLVKDGGAGVLDAAAIEKAKKDKLRFIASMASAEVAIQNAEKEITEPYGKPLPESAVAALEQSLANRIATLNAAINSLIVATNDHNNPDYVEAEAISKTIRELIPDIVKDSKSLSSTKDQKSRKELLEQIKALCEATRKLGASAKSEQLSPEELNEAATQYSLASGKLNFVFNPHADQKKTHQIIDTCKSACIKTSEMLQRVHEVAKHAGAGGAALDAEGAHVSDVARSLLTTAQLTAHSAPSPLCQGALLDASDRLSSSIQELQTTWTPITNAPKFKADREQLTKDKEAVDAEIVTLRRLVKDDGAGVKGKKPPVPIRAGSDTGAKRVGSEARVIGATREFLERLRCESSIEKECRGEQVRSPTSPSPSRTDEEKRAKLRFSKSVQDARKSINSAEEMLQKAFVSDAKERASLDSAQIFALNKQMEHKLARANAAAAHLLSCRGGDRPDYKLASKCVGAVSDLMPTIATDAITLADLKDPVGRKLFISDTMGLCAASKNLCDTAKNDKKKLKEVAVEFGNQSSKLLYGLNSDIDPSQEKEVLLRVKAAGDIACRLTEGSVEGPAAGRCAGQATVLMYTAKLVAPSIQDPECQDALVTASKDLSTQLKTIPATNPKLTQELMELEKILDALRSDVAAGKLVKRKEEKLVIEDTPLRKLTAQIIEDSKQNAECTTNSVTERRAMADFANKLTDALKIMDVANARCKQAPHDMKKREELEDAVLNLQHLVLQCRPRGGAVDEAQTNIVNLSDFLKDVTTNAERLQRAAHSAEQSGGAHARAAAAARAQCTALCAAVRPAHTLDQHGQPMLDVDRAAKECVNRVQKINTTIECCPEGAGKTSLRNEARPLKESCTLLQFASQSALATAQCAALDEALNDLTDLENRIDKMLQPRQGEKHIAQSTPSASLLSARARLAAAAARARRDARRLAPAFTRHVAAMRAHVHVADPQSRMRLADHLKKLQDRLKVLTMETGRQLVTWRPANEGQVVAITEDILKELDNAEAVIGVTEKTNTIAYEDLKKLLLPVDTYTMEGDRKKLEAKLEPYATKLNSMAETLTLSIGKPGLARSAHVTAESAVQLTALAKALKSDEDPTKNSRIDETSQELCFVTFNLLKTAESVSREPSTFESRRRMMDACRSLSDAINKLVRASSSGERLQRECNELNRALQLRQSTLQPRPTCALPYADCVSALQTQHDAIRNLKSEEPVSREEFSTTLDYLASAVSNNVDYAEHCAYLLSVSEEHPELSKDGMFDTERVQKMIATAQDSCFRATRPGIVHQAKEESSLLTNQLSDLKQAIQDSSSKVRDEEVKRCLLEASSTVDAAGTKLRGELNAADVSVEKLTPSAFATIEALSTLRGATEQPALAPPPAPAPAPAAQKRADEVIHQSKELLTRASGLMRAIKTSEDQHAMTWVMFNTYTKGVIEISEKLITSIRENGQKAGLIDGAIEDDDADLAAASYVQTQVLIANKWLHKPSFKAQVKTDGQQAARNVIDVGKKMMTHMKETDREEMRHLVEECEQLLEQCSAKYTLETGSVIMDRLKDLAKAIDRSIVTMVVEDLIEDEEPLADLDILVDAEKDEAKRKLMLERKIAELLAHLGRVTKTARVVADGQGGDGAELRKCTSQAELLAPMLVKAAEKRVIHPTEVAAAEEYRTQLAQYSESLSKVRDLCDRAVDPMQFVQTAEETMQRMKEESTEHQNDLQKCSNTSTAIRKLAHRVINVSMSSQNAQRDPELMRALTAAQQKLKETAPTRNTLRASKLPDWRNNITEILRATGEVESVLGGEMIFQKQRESDQPIYNAALNLHAAVREWSARDNEIVAVAKKMAVLMAKLSDHMHADRKREVISTSKAIVAASHEVARLARKLALECTDMRIRTNLLQVCDQIPTISGQLKMLTTVKGSFLGHQGSEEDIEAMNMLIGNAQNLMMSIQDVVKAAASASVKIRSQRGGPKIRWVRKNYH